ncbi:MAG: carboxylating nicotinate-nucleotide diphosphorylase [Chloroflexota bacterium]
MQIDRLAIQPIVAAALAEDLGWGDLTTDSLIAPGQAGEAQLIAKEDGVLAGIEVAALAFATVDPALHLEATVADGGTIRPGTILAEVSGSVAGMLKAERVALNFLQRMSGIATLTSHYVALVAGTGARVVDTRKTTPTLRALEKYAVRVGGGSNHRFCLSDGVLIKDNHLAAVRASGQRLSDALGIVRRRVPHTVRVEIEAETLADVEEALAAGADVILLDNMRVDDLRAAVRLIAGRAITEASGGINLTTIRAVAECGVDLISVGALTHSAKSLDIAMEVSSL